MRHSGNGAGRPGKRGHDMSTTAVRIALVTGANKGLGFETCPQTLGRDGRWYIETIMVPIFTKDLMFMS